MKHKTLGSIVKVSGKLKKKLATLKIKKFIEAEATERALAPLTKPLKEIATKEPEPEEEEQKWIDPKSKAQFLLEVSDDPTFGPKYNEATGTMTLGNLKYSATRDEIKVGKRSYPKTTGLVALIQSRTPNYSETTAADRQHYREILEVTNVHRARNRPDGKLKSSHGLKYGIIKRILEESPSGSGMIACRQPEAEIKITQKDPNRLCDRLRLLLASQQAGHTDHKREIKAILTQLRQGGYIL